MKKIISGAAVLVAGFIAQQSQAACSYPTAPSNFPDGNVASRDEMKAAKDVVVKYDADMKGYLVCLGEEHQASLAANPNVTPDQKADMERKHSQKAEAALAEVTDVVGRFNEQLKAWKAKNAAEKKTS